MTVATSEPSKSYGLSLALACVGITFVGIGVQAAGRALAGSDSFGGGSYGATIGALLSFGMLYLERATRWNRVPARLRRAISYAIAAVLVASMIGTFFCLYVAFSHPTSGELPLVMGLISAFCQVFTLYWLCTARPRYVSTAGPHLYE